MTGLTYTLLGYKEIFPNPLLGCSDPCPLVQAKEIYEKGSELDRRAEIEVGGTGQPWDTFGVVQGQDEGGRKGCKGQTGMKLRRP